MDKHDNKSKADNINDALSKYKEKNNIDSVVGSSIPKPTPFNQNAMESNFF